jgi:glycogen debranching enzyme
MPIALIRPRQLYAWKGPSLLVVNDHGDCGAEDTLTGYYFREARFLSNLRLEVNAERPWLCEAGSTTPDTLAFTYIYPELSEFGGGGSGQSGDETSRNKDGIPHRALSLRLTCLVQIEGLQISLRVENHSTERVAAQVAWHLDADFADLQEAHSGIRKQQAPVRRKLLDGCLLFTYCHPQLSYGTAVTLQSPHPCTVAESSLITNIRLEAQQHVALALSIAANAGNKERGWEQNGAREQALCGWRGRLARVRAPQNRLIEQIVSANILDYASFPMLQGEPDEWLAMQAGMPLYPALFGRDTLTAGWQAAFLDQGESLNASLARIGRMQSNRVDDWRDEEPGRIPYQVRTGPLAQLDLNPYSAYYADFASPLMFVIAMAHQFSWTGDKNSLRRHWDVARRILDWARDYGDKDRDGYLEYATRSPQGTKNQGWKDSGDAILYDDGRPVPAPLATCELQGYWFAAQQLMSIMSWVMGDHEDAKALWRSARELKERFNRDWWDQQQGCIVLALDPDKRPVRAVTSNAGHCIACGIVSEQHLPQVVGRLFSPDMFSGWGIRTLSAAHHAYNPLSYHLGSVWPVEQATIAFGLRRFGFDARALEIARALFDLAELYPQYRLPECVGGFPRGEHSLPGAYPRANVPQLWNASAFPLLIHTMLGLQPVALLETLVVHPALPTWLPEIVIHDLRLAGAKASLRFWRDDTGNSHAEVLQKRGAFRLLLQPPLESLSAGPADRFRALLHSVFT